MKRVWDDHLTERDVRVFDEAGYGQRAGFKERPALLVIDLNYAFVGDRREDIFASMKKFRNSCGEAGWDAMARLRPVLDVCRTHGIPIIYTTGETEHAFLGKNSWGSKNSRVDEAAPETSAVARNDFPSLVHPAADDIVIRKQKPSAFFGTPLIQYLVALGIDQLICCGTTTSGCVRATVVDAFSYNYSVAVIEDCTFDRGEASHAINLFDMHQKYADIVTADEVLEYFERTVRARPVATTR